MTHKARIIFIFLSLFLFDRLSKWIVLENYKEGQGFTVFPGFLRVTRVDNTGAAFGIFQGGGVFLIGISALFIALLGIFFFKKASSADFRVSLAWVFVVAGALGNLVDRVRYGYVVDFIDFKVWPVFNIADTSICIGVGLMILRFIQNSRVFESH